jgi:hypothetical protein
MITAIMNSENYMEKSSNVKMGIKRSIPTTTSKIAIAAITQAARMTRIHGRQNDESFRPHLLPTML